MRKFIEIEGFTIAVDAIVMIHPPGKEGKIFIEFVNGKGRSFSKEAVAKLTGILDSDSLHL